MRRVWQILPPQPEAQALARALQIHPLTAQALCTRGVRDPQQGREFLDSPQTTDPLTLLGMEQATAVIWKALSRGTKIVIYGDYDVDGVTSSVILYKALTRLGAHVTIQIPNRLLDDYGLSEEAVRQVAVSGAGLLITVDCGITSVKEVQLAKELGLKVIITDHHLPAAVLPDADAILNPKVDPQSPSQELAGVGVAFKLLQGLERTAPGGGWPEGFLPEDLLDLVAVGSIADLVPMVGENRALVRQGLLRYAQRPNPGLEALAQVAGVKEALRPGQISFGIAPRLNAAGRVESADLAVRCLLATEVEARELATQLDGLNAQRQEAEAQLIGECQEQIESQFNLDQDWVMVVAGEGWHPGVIGIAASRLVEKYHRPVVLIAIEGEEGRGSARSIKGFHLVDALSQAKDVLIRYGGHAMAAGLKIRVSQIPRLREILNTVAHEVLQPGDLFPRLVIQAQVDPADLSLELAQEIGRLAPFGIGNPQPTWATRGFRVASLQGVGTGGSHLKLRLEGPGGQSLEAIGFGLGQWVDELLPGERVDLAYQIEVNEWQGRSSLQLVIKDLVRAGEVWGEGWGTQVAAVREGLIDAPQVSVDPPVDYFGPPQEVLALIARTILQSKLDSLPPPVLCCPTALGGRGLVERLSRIGPGLAVLHASRWDELGGDLVLSTPTYLPQLPQDRWVLQVGHPGSLQMSAPGGRRGRVWAAPSGQVMVQDNRGRPVTAGLEALVRTGPVLALLPGDGVGSLIQRLSGRVEVSPWRPGLTWQGVAIATEEQWWDALAGVSTVALLGLPLSGGDGLAPLVQWGMETGGLLGLLFSDTEGERIGGYWEKRAPDREVLVKIYWILRRRFEDGEACRLPPADLACLGQNLWQLRLDAVTVRAGLEIFTEMGLLMPCEGTGRPLWRLALPGETEKKLDLTLSLKYNEGMRSREQVGAFIRWALKAPAVEWERWVSCPSHWVKEGESGWI